MARLSTSTVGSPATPTPANRAPHVRLGASGSTMRDAVLKTSQVPELIDCLHLVAERIDELLLHENFAAHITEIVDLLAQAEDIHEATSSIAALLGVEDSVALQARLLAFSLFGLTRDARAARTRKLQELREQP